MLLMCYKTFLHCLSLRLQPKYKIALYATIAKDWIGTKKSLWEILVLIRKEKWWLIAMNDFLKIKYFWIPTKQWNYFMNSKDHCNIPKLLLFWLLTKFYKSYSNTQFAISLKKTCAATAFWERISPCRLGISICHGEDLSWLALQMLPCRAW